MLESGSSLDESTSTLCLVLVVEVVRGTLHLYVGKSTVSQYF